MMANFPILSLLIFLPLLGVLFILTVRETEHSTNSYDVALWTSVVNAIVALVLLSLFEKTTNGFQFVENWIWLSDLGIGYKVGVDGISIAFVMLTALLMPICIMSSRAIDKQKRLYMTMMLLAESLVIGAFCALDTVIFYLFFEGSLIPMFFIIGIWGGDERIYAAFKFLLYTLTGSVVMLAGIFALYQATNSTDIVELSGIYIAPSLQYWLFWAFFCSFAVKVPMWPFHTWLPAAHVQAPTAGSVLLAAVLLKLGGYGFLRFSLPLFPDASIAFAPYIYALSAVAVVYASLVAWAQSDIKKLIAYSSVAHMGFVTAGIFTFRAEGIEGAIFQMVSHGVISAALFLSVGVLYHRVHSRKIDIFKGHPGLAKTWPRFACLFMVFTLGAVSLPGTSGFIGEFLILLAAWKIEVLLALVLASGMILAAIYMLGMYRRIFFVTPDKLDKKNTSASQSWPDVHGVEWIYLSVLATIVMALGLWPNLVLDLVGSGGEDLARILRFNAGDLA